MGKLRGGDGGADLSPTARPSRSWRALRSSSLTLLSSSFLACEATSASCILSCSERDAATFSCSVLIISITCVIDTASSSVDGATELDRVVLILSQQTQQLKETPNER